ncbi:MAG: HD domain-containing protein [bacterium]|nr:HD domain-containing protein [bacterium]
MKKIKSLISKNDARALIPDISTLSFINIFPFYIMLIDEDHRILLVNSAFERKFGIKQEQITGKYCPKVVHNYNRPFPGCPLEDVLRKGRNVEKEMYDKKHEKWLRSAVYKTRYRTSGGKKIFVHMVYDITEKKQAEDENKHNQQIQSVLSTMLEISSMRGTLEDELKLILKKILSLRWLGLINKWGVFLKDENKDIFNLSVYSRLPKSLLIMCKNVPFNRCLCGKAGARKKMIFKSKVDSDHENLYKGIKPHGHYCIPIIFREKVLGVLNLYVAAGHKGNKYEKLFFKTVADILAGIIVRKNIENELKENVDNLRKTLKGIVKLIVSTVEVRDPYTAGHQHSVSDLARAIAQTMGLPKDQVEGIRFAGIIHDLGKLFIPSEILSKPGHLNDIEYDLIKTHSRIGYEMLRSIDFPWPLADIILQHHEKMDGSGYPNGLKDKKILIGAKIIKVADVISAMAYHRPYRPAHNLKYALKEIKSNIGRFYDPEVVAACLKVFRNGYKLKG